MYTCTDGHAIQQQPSASCATKHGVRNQMWSQLLICSQGHLLLQTLLQLLLLHSGGVDGQVASFDLTTGEQVSSFQAATDTVNGLQFHPYLPLAATASGRPSTVLQCCVPPVKLLLGLCTMTCAWAGCFPVTMVLWMLLHVFTKDCEKLTVNYAAAVFCVTEAGQRVSELLVSAVVCE